MTGKVEIPQSVKRTRRRGLFSKTDWRKIMRTVEDRTMGSGGILEDHLRKVAQEHPLRPSTIKRKQREGLPLQPLIGKTGRLQRALTTPLALGRLTTIAKNKMRQGGGATMEVWFRASMFKSGTPGTSYTAILQRGRIRTIKTKAGKLLMRREAVALVKKGREGQESIAFVDRAPGRPVMTYRKGDEARITPVLQRAIHEALVKKGLAT